MWENHDASYGISRHPRPQDSVNQVVPFCVAFCFYFPFRNYVRKVIAYVSLFVSASVSWATGQPDKGTTGQFNFDFIGLVT